VLNLQDIDLLDAMLSGRTFQHNTRKRCAISFCYYDYFF